MSRPDSGAIDRVLLAVLQNDAELAALMPDGVWFGIGAQGLTRFVLVTLQDGIDARVFGQRAQEELTYLVQAVGLSRAVSMGDMKAAAYRIDTLLDGDVPLPVPEDYAAIDCVRGEPPLKDPVLDELDKSLTWYHFGSPYVVTASWPDPVITGALLEDSEHVD